MKQKWNNIQYCRIQLQGIVLITYFYLHLMLYIVCYPTSDITIYILLWIKTSKCNHSGKSYLLAVRRALFNLLYIWSRI